MKRWSMDAFCMFVDPDGEWVKYEDVEMLLSKIQHDHAICLKSVNHDYKCPAYETTEKARGEAK